MAKYRVSFGFHARYDTEVDADSLEEVKEKAGANYCDADFGEASDIDGGIISITDENGNTTYEN